MVCGTSLLAPDVRVNAIAPGPTRTGIVSSLGDPDEIWDNFAKMMPLKRVAEPIEMAQLIALVASDVSKNMTGSIVASDSGYLLGDPYSSGRPLVKLLLSHHKPPHGYRPFVIRADFLQDTDIKTFDETIAGYNWLDIPVDDVGVVNLKNDPEAIADFDRVMQTYCRLLSTGTSCQ
uniref:Dehydrogenase/reductase SDR family member 6 n=1 Tax=Tetranychus urticae TaxID=32264 RepID=T1KZC5_TETUR